MNAPREKGRFGGSQRSHVTTGTPERERIHHAFRVRSAPLPWKKAISAGVTLFIPLYGFDLLGHPSWGLLSIIGGFTSLYVLDEPLAQLARRLLVVMLGLAISFGLGNACAGSIVGMSVTFALVGSVATYVNQALRVPPPGAYFYILACAIGTGLPVAPQQAFSRAAFALIGGSIAWIIAVGVRLATLRRFQMSSTKQQVNPVGGRLLVALRWDSPILRAALRVAIGLFSATLIAYALGNTRPYWVPVGCAAVLQGTTMIATAHRAIQRAIGTSLGIVIAGLIFLLHPMPIVMASVILIFQTLVELFIVRNYGLAVIFITPLALTIAESAQTGLSASMLVQARLVDNLLGCTIGLIVGLLLWRRTAT